MHKQSGLERALLLWIFSFVGLISWSIHLVTNQEGSVRIASDAPAFFDGAGLNSARQKFDTPNCP
jgi:hypothetical protein